MAISRMYGDYEFPGSVALTGTALLPSGIITNSSVLTAANVAASKLNHRVYATSLQASGADVVTRTEVAHCTYNAATVLGVSVAIDTAPTGGDKAFTVDVKKSTAGGAFATILTGVLTVNSSSTSRTKYAATLSGTPTLIAGNLLEVVVTAAGSTGSQGQGVLVAIVLEENGT